MTTHVHDGEGAIAEQSEKRYHYVITARIAHEANQTWIESFDEQWVSEDVEEYALRLLFKGYVADGGLTGAGISEPEFEDFEGYVVAITEFVGQWSDVTIMYNEWGHLT